MLPTLLIADDTTGVKPIDMVLERVQSMLMKPATIENRLLFLKSETGSGKSTILPVFLYKKFIQGSNARGIICTQPRILTAKSLAFDIANIYKDELTMGRNVGYQTGPYTERPRDGGILYTTIGILINQLQNDEPLSERYSFIIVDEVHERSIDTDMLLYLLRNYYESGSSTLPFLLLASATFDHESTARFFGLRGTDDNVVHVAGRTYPIKTTYLSEDTPNYAVSIVERIAKIAAHDDPPDHGDVLVFLPGKSEMMKVMSTVDKQLDEALARTLYKIVLDRSEIMANSEGYQMLNEPLGSIRGGRYKRKLILATIVAETGLTIHSLKYVIDCCWARTKEVYFPGNVESLVTLPCTLDRMQQRKGRVGRVFPGEYFPMCTSTIQNKLVPKQYPEIITQGMGKAYLIVLKNETKTNGHLDVAKLRLLDFPSAESFMYSNLQAINCGFVASDYTITKMGELAMSFTRYPMELIRMVLLSFVFPTNVFDTITLAAILSAKVGPTELLTNNKGSHGADGADSEHYMLQALQRVNDMIDALPKKPESKELDTFAIILKEREELIVNFGSDIRLEPGPFDRANLQLVLQDALRLNILQKKGENLYTNVHGQNVHTQMPCSSEWILTDKLIGKNTVVEGMVTYLLYTNYTCPVHNFDQTFNLSR